MKEPDKLRSLIASRHLFSTAELVSEGISRVTIGRLVENGELYQFTRGIYVAMDAIDQENLSLAAISKLRNGVVCLTSAAAFHDLGDENPPEVWFAVDRTKVKNASIPSFEFGHQVIFWSPDAFSIGIDRAVIAGQVVAVTTPARTIVDLLHYRNKLTEEVALRAFADFIKKDGDIQEVSDIATELGRLSSLAPYLNMAEELKESIPSRSGP